MALLRLRKMIIKTHVNSKGDTHMEQVSSRFGRTVADMHGTDQDRARLLGQLAIGFGIAALLGGIAQLALWLFGLIVSPNYVPAVIASVLLMCAIVGATYWLTRQRRFKLATNVFLYSYRGVCYAADLPDRRSWRANVCGDI